MPHIPALAQPKTREPPNELRPQPINPGALTGAGEFVSRAPTDDPEPFLAPKVLYGINSIYNLVVSPDGRTALHNIVKSAKMAVGSDDRKMHTYFGGVILEEQLTIDLSADVPTVTNVQVAQRLADDLDIEGRYLDEKARIPQPPPVPDPVPRPPP